ncbi:MAG: saccharopine dehydrogenase [Oceanospirillaceae bacterium]|nr:saccharopine dehydrogenase [Oceanospirillaceae bacterium]
MPSSTPFHLIVYGATSFVGQILTRYLAETYGVGNSVGNGLHWAIAGRSQSKLESVRAQTLTPLGIQPDNLPIILTDAADDAALNTLCNQTRAVVSTVGPYALYGETLVKICAQSGTDYCDLTGEPQWIRRMLERYEATAKASGARIVHSCGFDSVPSDMGVWFLQEESYRRYGKPAVQSKMRFKAGKGGVSGGTVASMVELTKEVIANPALKKELANPYSICPAEHGFTVRQNTMSKPAQDTDMVSHTAPFIMAAINTRIVFRSNALRENYYGHNFSYNEAVLTGAGFKGWLGARIYSLGIGAFLLGAALKPTRFLLEKYVLPKPGEGPSPQAQEEGFYDLRFIGRTEDGQLTLTKVTGDRDPGYGSTAKMLGEAIVGLALDYYDTDGNKTGKSGGFWTPASLFDERYIERLQNKAGIKFEVLD